MRFAGLALLPLLMPVAAFAAEAHAEAAAISQQWLALVDGRDYGASWKEASPLFQKRIPQDKWMQAMTIAREPMGAVSTRKVANATSSKSLPGLPDGDYIIIQFETSFANKANAVETVTLIGGPGSQKVGGYFIK